MDGLILELYKSASDLLGKDLIYILKEVPPVTELNITNLIDNSYKLTYYRVESGLGVYTS